MNKDSVVFCCKHEVGRSCTSDASELCDGTPVLNDSHETCDTSVSCAVHHLINDISLTCPIVGKGLFLFGSRSWAAGDTSIGCVSSQGCDEVKGSLEVRSSARYPALQLPVGKDSSSSGS